MNELNLGHPETELDYALLFQRLLAVTAWPGDERRRQEFEGAHLLLLQDKLDATTAFFLESVGQPAGADILAAHNQASSAINEIGAEMHAPLKSLVAFAPGVDELRGGLEKSIREWVTPARILDTIMRMAVHHLDRFPLGHAGPSLNKAADMLERIAAQRFDAGLAPLYPLNRSTAIKIWSRYKTVAHLCAGWEAASEWTGASHSFEARVRSWLTAARAYQQFGTSFRAHGQQGPLLDATSIYRVPDTAPLHSGESNVLPLPEWMLTLLDGYKPPVKT